MYLTVMWNWGCFSGAFCDAVTRPMRDSAPADILCNAKMDTRLASSPPNPLHLRSDREERRMKSNQLISEIRWDRVPLVAGHADARAWLNFQACRGLAPNTLDAYGRNLERYLRFLNAAAKEPHEIGQETVGAYLRDLVKLSATGDEPDIRMANATIQQHLAVLRMFYDFLVEEARCRRNPFRRGEGHSARSLVQREHKLPTIPTEEEWCRILSETAKEPIRNRFMLAMSYDAGLRREELCLLETSDIDPSRRTIRIRAETTKNRRSRVLPYSAATDDLFGRYLDQRRTLSRERGRLFLSQSPRNRAKPISMWAWSKIVGAIAKRAAATGFTPHTLRHLRLTDLARADWDIHEIAIFAGHRNIETTMIYLHLSARDLAAKFNATMTQLHRERLELMGRLFQ
jgi:integrase/recombinase XerD